MQEKDQPETREISSVLSIQQLEVLFSDLRKRSFGMPLNQNKIDLTELGLSGLASHTISNLGDPYKEGCYKIQSKAYEREVINYIASLYELDDDGWGYITSGDSEGNLFSLYMGREYLERKSRDDIHDGSIKPVLFFSKAAHYSVPKAARIMGLQYRVVEADENGEMNYLDLEQAINQYQYRPMLFALNIGSTFTGATDDLQKVNNLLQKYNVSDHFIHCDAALSGMILPFVGKPLDISFEQGLDSIVISGDKLLGSPIPSAMVVTRKKYTQYIKNDVEVIGSNDITISGSRYGLAAIAIWYILQETKDSLDEEVRQCLDNAEHLYQLLKEQHYPCFLNENSITVVFKQPLSEQFINRYQLAVEDGWAHIVTLQHVTQQQLALFVDELIESDRETRKNQKVVKL